MTPHHPPLPPVVAMMLAGTLMVAGCGTASTSIALPDPTSDTSVSASGPSRASVATVRSFTPTTGGVGTSVRVDGFGFNATSRVFFSTLDPATGAVGFVAADTTFVSTSRLTALVPAGAVTGSIKVVTANAADALSPIVFTSTAPPPVVTPPGGGGGGTTVHPGVLADVLPQTGDKILLASLPAIVQLRANRLRIEVTGDAAAGAVCATTAVLPSLNALEALLDPAAVPPSNVGLRGRAMVVVDPLASPAGATPAEIAAAAQAVFSGPGQLTSVVPGLATIDVTDMPTPPDEPGVAVGNDAAGNVLEIIWNPVAANGFLQAPPIVRIQLSDPSLVAATDTLRIIWTFETYDKANPTVVFNQWWGQAGNITQ